MRRTTLAIALLILFTSLVSSGINITKPLEAYSLGDIILSTLTINPEKVEGGFEFKLVCGDQIKILRTINPSKSDFTANQETKITHKTILEKDYIGNLSGECYLVAELGSIISKTSSFVISREIIINAELAKDNYSPGETVVLNLELIKSNKELSSGFIELTGIFTFEEKFIDGRLTKNLTIEENQAAGNYKLNIYAYEKGENNQTTNEGYKTLNFSLNSVARSIPITMSKLEFDPGEEIEIKGHILDQTGNEINGTIEFELMSPKDKIGSFESKSGETLVYKLDTDAPYGEWKVRSKYGEISEERTIKITKKPFLAFNFIEDSSILKIDNLGNYNFLGDINITIGEKTKMIKLDLDSGEEKRFTLSAPNGEYELSINSGKEEIKTHVTLTGKAISIKETKPRLSDYPIVWIALILVVIAIIMIIIYRLRKTTFNITQKMRKKLESNRSLKEDSYKEEKTIKKEKRIVNSAESTPVINGIKEQTTIVVLKLKSKLENFAEESLNKILSKLNKKEYAIEDRGNEVIILLSPRKTKNYRNENSAIEFAISLRNELEEHNKKFKDKISFGIGINTGDVIAKLEKEKLYYIGVENAVNLSRKLSEISNGEILISESVKNKSLRESKTEKLESAGISYHKIIGLMDNKANEKKLKDLLKRTHFLD